MREQIDKLLRRSTMPRQRAHSSAVGLALVVALLITFLGTIVATAQVLPAPSSSVASPLASSDSPGESQAKIPEVARRLWRDLLCSCPEKDCEHESLEACRCDYAAKRRSEILEQVRRLGFGSPTQDDATYAAVFRNYVKVHGQGADGSRPRPNSEAPVWIEAAVIAGAVAMAGVMISWLVDRMRGHPIAGTNAAASGRPSRRKKNVRKRR
jgi:hypothetical protein